MEPASATWVTSRTKPWNCSFLATKSVSLLTSTIAPRVPSVATPTRPSAATRPAFLAAAARPLVRSQSIDASMSPWFSASAFLQSIMPAPVRSRSSLTRAAVISAMGISFQKGRARNRPAVRRAHGEAISQNDDWDGPPRMPLARRPVMRARSGVALAFGFGGGFGRDLLVLGGRSGFDGRSGLGDGSGFGDGSSLNGRSGFGNRRLGDRLARSAQILAAIGAVLLAADRQSTPLHFRS